MSTRRHFLKQVATFAALAHPVTARALTAYGAGTSAKRVILLHTNDTHARIDPFQEGAGDYAGRGGVARRMALIHSIRTSHPDALLLDAGDVFQGTPYFNFYGGALDFELMSMMGYDASTIGNHEFDNKVEGFVRVAPKAQFPFVISNYTFEGAPAMGVFTRPTLLKEVDGIRIGIFGLGVSFDNLVLPELHQGVGYRDPMVTARAMVNELRNVQRCDLVVCLSHLGYAYDSGRVSDRVVAQEVDGIDCIIGGHTHTLLEEPELLEMPGRHPTVISQVGHAGVVLGQLEFEFTRTHRISRVCSANQTV